MAGALGNGPREALGEEVDFVRLSKRKSVDEASVSKVARVVTEVEATIGSKGAIVSEAAIGSKGVIVSEAAIGYEGAIVSEAIGSEGAIISKGPHVCEASKFPDVGAEEGFEESLDLDEVDEVDYTVVNKSNSVKKQCESVVAMPKIQAPLLVVPEPEAATDDETITTAHVMGQMAKQMFSGMLKTLLDSKADKK